MHIISGRGFRATGVLQKMYPVARNVVAGFAGDVQLGFAMLEDLAQLLREERPAPETMSEFSRTAKARFAGALAHQREGGSELLIAYVLPDERMVYGGRPVVCRLHCPDFNFEEIPRGTWGSIGSGTDIPAYQQELEKLTGEETDPLLQMEANWPGGYAHTMFVALTGAIAEFDPVPGISRHFHSCVVTVEGWEGGSSDRTMFGPDGEVVEIKMPKVATSFGELQELLHAEREAATVGAVAAPALGQQMGQHAPQIPADLDSAKTALERAPQCPAGPPVRAHNPKIAGSNPAPAMWGSPLEPSL